MKATIERGRVILPKEIFEKGYLPDNGEIEVEAMEGWLKIVPKKASRILKDLEKPSIRANIDEIIKAEVVEDV
jgi:hypothetical protein